MLAGFHYPQELQARTNPASSVAYPEVGTPSSSSRLHAGDDAQALGSQGGWGRSINAIFLKIMEGPIFTLIGFQAEQSI